MIAYLSGRVIGKLENHIILKLPSGVGYGVNVSREKRYMVNENLDFYIWHVFIRDGGEELYGFDSIEDRQWAEKLTKVSGVGPKAAANMIYTLGWQKILEAIQKTDTDILSSVKGLGLKTAKKIVLELKGGATDMEVLQDNEGSGQLSIDFTDTLSNLGYKRGEIVGAISKLKKDGQWQDGTLVDLVKKGLEILGKR